MKLIADVVDQQVRQATIIANRYRMNYNAYNDFFIVWWIILTDSNYFYWIRLTCHLWKCTTHCYQLINPNKLNCLWSESVLYIVLTSDNNYFNVYIIKSGAHLFIICNLMVANYEAGITLQVESISTFSRNNELSYQKLYWKSYREVDYLKFNSNRASWWVIKNCISCDKFKN